MKRRIGSARFRLAFYFCAVGIFPSPRRTHTRPFDLRGLGRKGGILSRPCRDTKYVFRNPRFHDRVPPRYRSPIPSSISPVSISTSISISISMRPACPRQLTSKKGNYRYADSPLPVHPFRCPSRFLSLYVKAFPYVLSPSPHGLGMICNA